jgi:uncharacterized protein YbjT (DUF2867 family)
MILVTGATGKVGRELVKELNAAGAAFRVGARDPGKVTGMDAVFFDYDRPETFEPALAGAEKFFLLTPDRNERELAAVETAKRAGVRHLVKLSVWGADEDAFAIGRAHRAVEKAVEASGIPHTFLRPNGLMQNFSTYRMETIRSQSAFFDACGEAKHSIVDARDVAAVAAKVLTGGSHAGKVYKLSGPEALSNAEMADSLSRAAGRTIRYVVLNDADYRKGLMDAGIPEIFADALVDLDAYYRSGAPSAVTPDVEKVLGRKPRSFHQFARDHAAVWQ